VPTDRLPEQQLPEQASPSEELSDVLSWGEQVGLIGSGDRLLLSSLGAYGSVGLPDSLSQRTGIDVGVSVGKDGGGVRTLARDSAQTGAAEHRRSRVSLPGRANSRRRSERTSLLREQDVIVCDSIRECCEGLLEGAPRIRARRRATGVDVSVRSDHWFATQPAVTSPVRILFY
jgi:hypothetical protein